jgi:hypothetical protein
MVGNDTPTHQPSPSEPTASQLAERISRISLDPAKKNPFRTRGRFPQKLLEEMLGFARTIQFGVIRIFFLT